MKVLLSKKTKKEKKKKLSGQPQGFAVYTGTKRKQETREKRKENALYY
jgi:hypothetical protein